MFHLNRKVKTIAIIACMLAVICVVNLRRSIDSSSYNKKRANAFVNGVRESRWIANFPHLLKALHDWLNVKSQRLTSPRNTKIELEDGQSYNRGGVLRAKITAFDERRRQKQYGGDFFFVTLKRPGFPQDGITCEATDKADGTYSIECILPWAGSATLNATLVHPSESIFELMRKYSSERHLGINLHTKIRNSKGEEENTICSVAFPDKRLDEVCDYSNPTHGEKRTCLKPPSGECSQIIWQTAGEDPEFTTIYDQYYFRKDYNFHAPIRGNGITVTVTDSGLRDKFNNYRSKSRKSPSLDPMTPTGWFYNSAWTPLKPKNKLGVHQAVKTCTRNKTLYFIGDSTMRMIYQYFLKNLKLNDTGLNNTVAWSRGRDSINKVLNLTMHYRSHGPPLLNPGPEDARPYISDTLDSITDGGKGTVVFLTLGYHFHTLAPDVFLSRLRIIKEVIKHMICRLPGIRVVIKGLHYHASDLRDRLWLTYRLEVLLRNELGNIPGVTYVELWDWTLVSDNKALHPIARVLDHMVTDLLAAFC